jgi:hypothetical protein
MKISCDGVCKVRQIRCITLPVTHVPHFTEHIGVLDGVAITSPLEDSLILGQFEKTNAGGPENFVPKGRCKTSRDIGMPMGVPRAAAHTFSWSHTTRAIIMMPGVSMRTVAKSRH